MIKAIIFDCFGVLYKDPELEILRSRGAKTTPEHDQLTLDFDLGKVTQPEKFASLAQLINEDVASVEAEMKDLSSFNHDLLELVRELKPKYKLGMLSNINNEFFQPFLKNQDLGSYFDVVITSEDVNLLKPDPRIFKLMIEKLQVEPNEAIFIDDRDENVRGGEDFGMHSILFTGTSQIKRALGTKLKG